MELKFDRTNRGFAFAEFEDLYGDKCSIQKSSLATDDAIWLGVQDPEPKVCIYGEGWKPFPLPDGVQLSTRMHLNQNQVAALIPILQHFVATGELPTATEQSL